jgi:hypothetical protein
MSHFEINEDDYRAMKNGNLQTHNSNRKTGLAVNIIFIIIGIVLICIGIFLLDSKGWGIVLFCIAGFMEFVALCCLYDNVKHLRRIRKVMKEKKL